MCPCPKVKVKGEIMYCLVNISPPKPLGVVCLFVLFDLILYVPSNFKLSKYMVWLDKKRVFAMVYNRLKSSYTYNRYLRQFF